MGICTDMARTALMLSVLLAGLTTLAVASSAQPCTSLQGEWINELDSKMLISSEQDGILKGLYQTGTSSKPPLPPPRELRGYVTTGSGSPEDPKNALFTFNVNWPDSFSSMTTWIGQCYVGADGNEILTTMWVLASRTDADKLWAANTVNTDVFHRAPKGGDSRPIPGDRNADEL